MAALGGLLSVALPWLAGALFVRMLLPAEPRSMLLALGYGYLLGALAAAAFMWLFAVAGVRWHPALLALSLVAVALLSGWRAPPLRPPWRGTMRTHRSVGALPAPARIVFWAALALIVVRLAGLGLEVLWRPLLPFDAWTQWADKARIWFEHGRMVPFVTAQHWLSDAPAGAFTDPHPHYPPTIPLLQVWTTIWLGGWDESHMNLPWIALAASLACAFYARARAAQIGVAGAMLATYLLISLPFLDIHLALAGVADIFVGVAYFLAAAALWSWSRARRRGEALLAALLALGCAAIKVEGLFWALTLVPAALFAWHRRAGYALTLTMAIAAAAYLIFGPPELRLYGYVVHTQFSDVSGPLLQHLFVMDDWHLLWYAAIAVLIAARHRLFTPSPAPLTIAMLGAAGVVGVVFFFSSAAGGVADESLVSRLLLQVVPTLAFYLVVLVRESLRAGGEEADALAGSRRPIEQPTKTSAL